MRMVYEIEIKEGQGISFPLCNLSLRDKLIVTVVNDTGDLLSHKHINRKTKSPELVQYTDPYTFTTSDRLCHLFRIVTMRPESNICKHKRFYTDDIFVPHENSNEYNYDRAMKGLFD